MHPGQCDPIIRNQYTDERNVPKYTNIDTHSPTGFQEISYANLSCQRYKPRKYLKVIKSSSFLRVCCVHSSRCLLNVTCTALICISSPCFRSCLGGNQIYRYY